MCPDGGCTSDSNPALPCWVVIVSVPATAIVLMICLPLSLSVFPNNPSSQASCWFCSWTLSLSKTCDCLADLFFIAWSFFCWRPAAPSRLPELRSLRSDPMLKPWFTEAVPVLHLLVCLSVPPAKPLLVVPGLAATPGVCHPALMGHTAGSHHQQARGQAPLLFWTPSLFCAPTLSPCGVFLADSPPTPLFCFLFFFFFLFASFSF